jgi:hypothetical protein
MADDQRLSFEELVDFRQSLQQFCNAEYAGIVSFKDGLSFKVYPDDDPLPADRAHHLSSTATCYEALLDCPTKFRPAGSIDVNEEATSFVDLALQRSYDDWKSDGSAPIYCRCRTLPLVIRLTKGNGDEITRHIAKILEQLNDDSRLAIGEASGSERQDWYPPNAYHTYWALTILEIFEARFKDKCKQVRSELTGFARIRSEMLLWANKTAAYQVALHSADSPALDSDQLAWALAILFRFGRGFEADIAEQDFVRTALECLFEQQNNAGIWRTGRPLFHYEKSGNAYCYIFETFSILLKCALGLTEGTVFLREALQPHGRCLIKLWNHANATRILHKEKSISGWSSGHRINRKDAESWATASVYAYANCLRRLIGIWTREAAARELAVSKQPRPEENGVKVILERGDTWSRDANTVAAQLMTLFVNPVLSRGSTDPLEPDSEPITKNQARSAILFGPPGTSKTTVSRAVAQAIGWDYVELYASHFVAGGLPEVQRTADRIFKQLMQLDRTVILFDEIDELVREREIEADAFGRFLTTSMLPRLAELWKRRKVIYFVATNHIDYFDSAIIRAERFDAILRVPPPSFEKKINRLQELLADRAVNARFSVDLQLIDVSVNALRSEREVENISSVDGDGSHLPETSILAKFLLLRWDQLDELAANIVGLCKGTEACQVTPDLLGRALKNVADPFLDRIEAYEQYIESEKYERRDFSKILVWEVVPCDPPPSVIVRKEQDRWWFESISFTDLPSELKIKQPGLLECAAKTSRSS